MHHFRRFANLSIPSECANLGIQAASTSSSIISINNLLPEIQRELRRELHGKGKSLLRFVYVHVCN